MTEKDVIILPVTPEIVEKTQRNVVKKFNFTVRSLMYSRTPVELLDNLYMGDMAKNAIYEYLRTHCINEVIDYDEVRTDNFKDHDPGWDIMVGTKKLKVEIKSSTPPNNESIADIIAKRDIKITASHDKGKSWRKPEDIESDIHVQVYFYATPYKNGYSSFEQLSAVITRNNKKVGEIIKADKYKEPLFLGYNTKENIVEYINNLPAEKRTWTFAWTDRIYWKSPIRLAFNMQSLIDLIDQDAKIPQRIIPLYYSVQEDEQYSKYLPFYEVKVACGAFIEGGIPEELGWIDVEAEGIRANNKRFIVKASGDSMLPKIKSGDLCVFERNWAGSRNGQIVLAQSRDFDPDYTGKYTIKKYQSVTNQTSEWDMQKSVDLIPLNQDYEVIHLSEDDDVQIIGVLIGTIQSGEFKELEEPEEPHIGYCIRCGKAIDYSFNNEKPILYCKECWRAWRSNGSNPDAPEQYCHRCGKSAKPKYKDAISYDYPICADCWKDR